MADIRISQLLPANPSEVNNTSLIPIVVGTSGSGACTYATRAASPTTIFDGGFSGSVASSSISARFNYITQAYLTTQSFNTWTGSTSSRMFGTASVAISASHVYNLQAVTTAGNQTSSSLGVTGSLGIVGQLGLVGNANVVGNVSVTGSVSATAGFSSSFSGSHFGYHEGQASLTGSFSGSALLSGAFQGHFSGSANLPDLVNGAGVTSFMYDGSNSGSVSVSGASTLNSNAVTKWTGAAFANSSLTDDGTVISGASSIQLTGLNSKLTGSFQGTFTGSAELTGSITGTATLTGSFNGSGSLSGSFTGSLSGSFTGSANLPDLTEGVGIVDFMYDGSGVATIAVSGAATLNSDTITKWTGNAFANTSLTDNGTVVSGASSIQLSGTGSKLTGSFTGDHHGYFTGSAALSGSFTGSFNGQFTGSANLPDLTEGVGIVDFMYDGSAPATIAVSGASSLNVNAVTKWTGTAFANTSLTDNGTVVSGASSIQLSGTGSKLTGSFTGDHHGQFTGSLNGCSDCARNGITTGSGLSDIQTINGSLTVTNNLQVLGSASITYVTSSQVLINSASIGVFADSATFQTASYFAFDVSNPANNGKLTYNANTQLWSFDRPLSTSLNKSVSNGAGIAAFSYNGNANATVAIDTSGVVNSMIASGTIQNDRLANNRISNIPLGSNLFDLTAGAGITLANYNGSATQAISISTGSITNAMIANNAITINGTSTALGGSYTMQNLSAGSGITLANYNGSTAQTISISTGSITNAMIANNAITINGTSTALGGSYTLQNLTAGAGITLANYNGTTTQAVSIANGAITNAMLANSTISGVALGSNLFDLTVDASSIEFSSGGPYNGGAAAAIRVKALGITDAMLAGSISNSKLTNSAITINGVSTALGGSYTLQNLTAGAGITLANYNGSTTQAISIANDAITNAMLLNDGIVVNGVSASLGGSIVVTANLANALSAGSNLTIGAPFDGSAAQTVALATTLTGLTSVSSTGFTGSLSGNALTATTLQTARNINGVSFNGSSNITITAATPNALSFSSELSGGSFDGSAAKSIGIQNASVTNTMLANNAITINGTSTALGGSYTMANLTAGAGITLANYNGSTTQAVSIANGAISNAMLANSTISGKALGTNLDNLTNGLGIAALSYNGSGAATVALSANSISINGSSVALGASGSIDLQSVCNVGFATTTNINAAAFFQTSKRDKKKDIAPFSKSALEIIGQTEVVEFKYKDDENEKVHIGFIADDTPWELATKSHDVMDTNSTVGVLLKAIQELEAKIKELEAKIK